MNILEELKEEHRDIERELIELEEIINSDIINYPNLVHTFTKLYEMWNAHERKEEILFLFIEELIEGMKIPIERMLFEHEELRPHRNAIKDAINSGHDEGIRKALVKNGKVIISKLRNHINFEDEILYRIELPEMDNEKSKELINTLSNLEIIKYGK